MDNAKHIAAQIGQKRIATALGVGATAVNNAVVRGKFTAAWFPIIRRMCEAEGIECPEVAFNFKATVDDHSGSLLSRKPQSSAGLSE